jgi:hypothetical protein
MPAPYPEVLRKQFALWVAAGGKVADWCQENGVSLKTAYTWYRSEAFKREVGAYRRREADRAIERLAKRLGKVVERGDLPIGTGRDDGGELASATALVGQLLSDREYAELKARLRRLRDRIGSII